MNDRNKWYQFMINNEKGPPGQPSNQPTHFFQQPGQHWHCTLHWTIISFGFFFSKQTKTIQFTSANTQTVQTHSSVVISKIAVRPKCTLLLSCCMEDNYLTHSHFQLIKGVHMAFWFIKWRQSIKKDEKMKMAPWVLWRISWLCFV